MSEHKITLRTLYRYLRRYWRGQIMPSFHDYANSGGRRNAKRTRKRSAAGPRIYGDQGA